MDFANVTKLVIPQGEVIQIRDSLSRILWEKTPTSIPPYFYIEDLSGKSNTITIKKWFMEEAPTITVEKSTDGVNWASMGASSTSGISATIPANGRLYLRCNATTWSTADLPNCIESSGNVKAGGNIMSLLYGSNFTGNETTFPSGSTYTFQLLFTWCKVVDARDLVLPATTLVHACYAEMFSGCTSLTTAPVLPATTLAGQCYNHMFDGCSSLNSIVMMTIEWDMANTDMWLHGVNSLGTFGVNPIADYGSEVIGDPSGIPNGWEIIPVE